MEILIAIGILAVGGAMAAALFPAAIKENQSCYNDTLGSIICDNALGTLKAIYIHDPAGTSADPNVIDTTATTVDRRIQDHPIAGTFAFKAPRITTSDPWGYLGPICHYPINNTTAPDPDKRGFYFMAQHTGNDYTFVIISYNREAQLPEFTARTCTLDTVTAPATQTDTILVPDNEAEANDPSDYTVNTLVIIDSGPAGTVQGEYARVIRINNISGSDTELILDHKLNTPPGSTVNCWTFQEPNTIRSPAMNVLVTRTALPEN